MDETVRRVAFAIAEAWWRKNQRRAAGSVPEASSSAEYAANYWQGFTDEARAAIAAVHAVPAPTTSVYSGSAFLAPIS